MNIIKNKKIALAIIVILLGFIIYNFTKTEKVAQQEIKVVEVDSVKKKSLDKTIRLTGKIKARYSASLSAKVPGVFNIVIPAGSKAVKDTVIARTTSAEVEKRFLLSGAAEVIAKEQFNRAQNLFKSGAYSKAEFEAIHNKWISAQKDLADAKITFDKSNIIAPFDGVIGNYKFRDGAQLSGNESIVSFYDPSNVSLDFDIPASAIPSIQDGQKVIVAGQEYKLPHVQKMLEDDKHMSPASLDITCDKCLIGSNLDLELTVQSKDNVIVIPFEAMLIRDGNSSVYVVKDGKAELRKIELGMRQKEEVEILSGLEAGEVIVIKATNRLHPNAAVRVHKPSEKIDGKN
jgi:membrane fusion protein (multidrug efflux system)